MKPILATVALIFSVLGPTTINPCGSGALVAQTLQSGCCKICKAGKACGDTCISRDKECHKVGGCACDG